jgi:hypothetical protein
LTAKQERFRKRPAVADLERAKVLVSVTLRHFRLRSDPETKVIEMGDTDGPVTHPAILAKVRVNVSAGILDCRRLDTFVGRALRVEEGYQKYDVSVS